MPGLGVLQSRRSPPTIGLFMYRKGGRSGPHRGPSRAPSPPGSPRRAQHSFSHHHDSPCYQPGTQSDGGQEGGPRAWRGEEGRRSQ